MRYPISLSSVLCAQLIALGVQRLQRKSTFFIGILFVARTTFS